MRNVLMVPIHLDALYLRNDRLMVEPMADFSLLPYFDGTRDKNPNIANISEELVSKPFQNQNLCLKAGIHLHWSLPDALTKGKHTAEGTDFPPAPNRWLVIRSKNDQGNQVVDESWVVESDYLHPKGAFSASIPFPIRSKSGNQDKQPFRYMGRRIPLNVWQENDTDAEYLMDLENVVPEKLTAVGYGQPAFAAFYPNCHSVFGFHDDEYTGDDEHPDRPPVGLQYELIGWYSDPERDYLRTFADSFADDAARLVEAIKQDLKWAIPLVVEKKKIPGCFGDADELWEHLKNKGWLKDIDEDRAFLVPEEQRSEQDLDDPFKEREQEIGDFLDEIAIVIKKENLGDGFGNIDELWPQLIDNGWLRGIDKDTGIILPKANRSDKDLGGKSRVDRGDIENFLWEYVLGQIPGQMIFYARLVFRPEKNHENPAKNDGNTRIVVGITGTEALSAHLASAMDSSNKEVIEDLLESLHLSARLGDRQLDLGPKFEEARHEKGFTAIPAGSIWTIRPEAKTHSQADADAVDSKEQVTLPTNLGDLLNDLNRLQQDYDKALHEIESMRRQLFSDWYKYMLCAYPPEGARDEYPDIDEVKYSIEESYIEENVYSLKHKISSTGELILHRDSLGRIRKIRAREPSGVSLASSLSEAFKELSEALVQHNIQSLLLKDDTIRDWPGFTSGFIKSGDKLPDHIQRIWELLTLDAQGSLSKYMDNREAHEDIDVSDKKAIRCSLNEILPKEDFLDGNVFKEFISYEIQSLLATKSDWSEQERVLFNRLILESCFPKEIKKCSRNLYTLKQISSPRYWRPNEPVVLMTGAAVKPTDRHGQDGRLSGDGLLECHILQGATIQELIPEKLEVIRKRIDELGSEDNDHKMDEEPMGFSVWDHQPWHPFLLEWMVEVFPLRNGSNIGSEDGNYKQDFITSNYKLDEKDPDLKNIKPGIVKAANVYSGSCILTPHASIKLKEELETNLVRMMKPGLLKRFYEKSNVSAEDQNDTWLKEHIDQVTHWYKVNSAILKSFYDEKGISAESLEVSDFISWLLQEKLGVEIDKFIYSPEREDARKEFYDSHYVPPEDRSSEYLNRHIAQIISWYLSRFEVEINESSPGYKDIKKEFFDDLELSDKEQEEYDLDSHRDEFNAWYRKQLLVSFHAAIFISAYNNLSHLNCLSQSLGGFNEALIMRKQTMQLGVSDPLGFDDYQPFARDVFQILDRSIRSAPDPLNDFNPIRTGAMKIIQLRLVDTFGQVKDLDCSNISTTVAMTTSGSSYLVSLPPRLVQPARINFRWLSADKGEQEMNDHPATTPICGWLLPNNLDNSLMVYDNAGKALGSITMAGWRPAPGSDAAVGIDNIESDGLKKLVRYITKQNNTFLENFITVLDNALENIEPESFVQHQDLALLMGRPIAVVRARLNLEVQGLPVIHQGWNAFYRDMNYPGRETDNFTQVKFPIRIGEYRQLNDGLVGYLKEKDGDGYEEDRFYAPQSFGDKDSPVKDKQHIRTHHDGPVHIHQTLLADPQILTILMDPRGRIHATSGILPVKEINIPPDQYAEALKSIEITFLSTPILTHRSIDWRKIELPLPVEPGCGWSWLEQIQYGKWSEIPSRPMIDRDLFIKAYKAYVESPGKPTGEDVWGYLSAEVGWLRITKSGSDDAGSEKQNESEKAFIVPRDRRKIQSFEETPTGKDFTDLESVVEEILDLYQSSIRPVSLKADFTGQQEIREGWLKMRVIASEQEEEALSGKWVWENE